MKQRLFVYGTLAPGRPNEHILSKIGGSWLEGSVRGRLEHIGWGSEMGYPAIELDACAEPVGGYVFESEHLSNHWAALDAFEGPDYCRVLTKVETQDRTLIDAYVYVVCTPFDDDEPDSG